MKGQIPYTECLECHMVLPAAKHSCNYCGAYTPAGKRAWDKRDAKKAAADSMATLNRIAREARENDYDSI